MQDTVKNRNDLYGYWFCWSDYERGEYDACNGHAARECEPASYYNGYGDAYAKEQSATWYSEQTIENMRKDND